MNPYPIRQLVAGLAAGLTLIIGGGALAQTGAMSTDAMSTGAMSSDAKPVAPVSKPMPMAKMHAKKHKKAVKMAADKPMTPAASTGAMSTGAMSSGAMSTDAMSH